MKTFTGRKRTAVIAFFLMAGAVAALFWRGDKRRATEGAPSSGPARTQPSANAPSGSSTPRGGGAGEPPAEVLRAGLRRFQGGMSRDDAKEAMGELAARLAALPAAEASAAVREFLASTNDAPTGLGFKLRADGGLDEAPTWRLFLLDALAKTDPTAAAALAREILRQKTSPDEWAVCLRNVARVENSAEGRAFLEAKTSELLRHEPWQVDPSAGYLEAFDVAVHVGGTNLVPPLAALARRQDNQAVAHAAFIALDRMTLRDAEATLGALQAQPGLMAGRELTRANFFARADVRETGQRAVLDRYLENPALGAAELERFAGLFPNANFMISQNLLTRSTTPDHTALVARDAAALQVLDEWLADARFGRARAELLKTRERLALFVEQAKGR